MNDSEVLNGLISSPQILSSVTSLSSGMVTFRSHAPSKESNCSVTSLKKKSLCCCYSSAKCIETYSHHATSNMVNASQQSHVEPIIGVTTTESTNVQFARGAPIGGVIFTALFLLKLTSDVSTRSRDGDVDIIASN